MYWGFALGMGARKGVAAAGRRGGGRSAAAGRGATKKAVPGGDTA